MQKLFDSSKEQEIITLYNSGLSTIKLAEQNKCSVGAINNVLKRSGVPRRSNKENRRLYTINHDFFDVIDTEEKAYWLGFLYADGNVRKHKNQSIIQLKVEDREIIEKFLKSIGSNMPVGEYKNWNGADVFGAHITSDKMFEDLCKHGCVPNKSLILEFPKTVPSDLIHHFIRGYFDGDGSVFITRKKWIRTPKTLPRIEYTDYIGISFNGTKELLEGINEHFYISTVSKEKRRTTNTWILRTNTKNVVKNFYNYIYSNATVYLNRKYEKFKEFYKKDVQRL